MTTKIPVELSSTPGIVDGSNATAITIDSDEKVGIGVTSPEEFLQVHGGIKTTGGFLANTANSMGMSYSSNYGHFISWGDNSTQGKFKFTGTAGDGSPSGDLASLDSDGLKFGSDTAAANALDDYEEGSWTPTLPNGGSITVNTATYTKIGRKVTAYCYIQFTATNNTSIFFIGGLPYNTPNNGNYYAGGSLSYSGTEDTSSFSDPLIVYNSDDIYFHYLTGTAAQVKNNQFAGRTVNMITQVHYDAA